MNPHQSHPTSPSDIFRSFWHNRQLIWQLTRRDVFARYRGSFIGLAWAFLQPLLMLAVYTFVFSVVFKARWDTATPGETRADFAIILFAGMIVFTFIADVLNRAPVLIIANVNYVKKVVFPLEILAWVSTGTVLFHSMISLLILLFAQLLINHRLPWTVLLFPLVMLPLIMAGLGLSWFLAALGVYVRDVGQLISIFTTVLMFVSTVFYPLSALPAEYQFWLKLNPLVLVITESRNTLVYGLPPDWIALGVVYLLGLGVAAFGFWWFQKIRRGFADVL